MLLQTNSYIVPPERRGEHARLVRRFRQTLLRLGCANFEVYEQVGANWSAGESSGRFVQIMRFTDRKQQLAVQNAERHDPQAQAVIAEFCDLINFSAQQQQGLFAVGFYTSVLTSSTRRLDAEPATDPDETAALSQPAAGPAAPPAAAAPHSAHAPAYAPPAPPVSEVPSLPAAASPVPPTPQPVAASAHAAVAPPFPDTAPSATAAAEPTVSAPASSRRGFEDVTATLPLATHLPPAATEDLTTGRANQTAKATPEPAPDPITTDSFESLIELDLSDPADDSTDHSVAPDDQGSFGNAGDPLDTASDFEDLLNLDADQPRHLPPHAGANGSNGNGHAHGSAHLAADTDGDTDGDAANDRLSDPNPTEHPLEH